MLEGAHEVSLEGFLHLDHAFTAMLDEEPPQANSTHDVRSETCQRVSLVINNIGCRLHVAEYAGRGEVSVIPGCTIAWTATVGLEAAR